MSTNQKADPAPRQPKKTNLQLGRQRRVWTFRTLPSYCNHRLTKNAQRPSEFAAPDRLNIHVAFAEYRAGAGTSNDTAPFNKAPGVCVPMWEFTMSRVGGYLFIVAGVTLAAPLLPIPSGTQNDRKTSELGAPCQTGGLG